MSKTQRWEWAIGLNLEELGDDHLQQAYKLNWDNLCKFDNCRKNCKRILCLACFDRTWIDNDSANNNNYDNFDTTNVDQKRTDLKSFVGLKNLGATCYVNCLLQLWFHNPALRKAIYQWNITEDRSESQQNNETNTTTTTTTSSTFETGQKTTNIGQAEKLAITNHEQQQQTSPKTPSKRIREEDESPAKKAIKTATDSGTNNLAISPITTVPKESSSNKALSKSPVVSSTSPNGTHKPNDLVQKNPIEQLQLIFARLQFTNKKSIDPYNFIESLALNAAEQQDAQEFGNLFIEFLEKSFAHQRNSFVSNIIKQQFLGRYSYATICDHCKQESVSDSNFYELDLSIQNLETLHDCLDEYFRPVPLDGKYNCSQCKKAQSAHRKIILKSLPPTLNLQLLRFVYDKQRNTRQKLNSFIIFPEILDMTPYINDSRNSKIRLNPFDLSSRGNSYLSNGTAKSRSNIFILSAVLIHRGSSPHSGHYIAHIKDRVTKDWYKFNDDSVERIGPQLQVSSDGENITIVEDKTENVKFNDPATGKVIKVESKSLKSKTAYMLVYQSHDNEALTYPSDHSEKWVLPDHLQTAVAEENSKSDQIFESLQIAKEVDEQVMNARKNQIRLIYESLVCRDPTEKFEFIDKTWLQNWLTNSSSSAKFPPIDNSHLLCVHDKLDFRKIDQVKCVRSEGADLLYREFGGGRRLQDAMCRTCVELEVKLIHLKERMKEDQKYITSQAKFKLDVGYDFADAYIVGKNSYRDWQALVMVQFEKAYPELMNGRRERRGNQQNNSSDEEENKSATDNNNKTTTTDNNNKSEVVVVSASTSSSSASGPAKNDDRDDSNSDSDDEAMEKFVFNSDILCEHNQLVNDTSAWRIVPKEVWMIFKRYFGDNPERPLIERNANTIMCADCKREEVKQQEIGDIQKQIASEQKSKLPDLFHNRKRATWTTMVPGDVYYALDRQFMTKWQKFIRNPCNQDQPTAIKHEGKLVCKHGMSLYNSSNSNPILPECPFVLISPTELMNLNQFYCIDKSVKFMIDEKSAKEELELHLASLKNRDKKSSQVTPSDGASSGSLFTSPNQQQQQQQQSIKQLDNSGDHTNTKAASHSEPGVLVEPGQASADEHSGGNGILETSQPLAQQQQVVSEAALTSTPIQQQPMPRTEPEIDMADIDWSECVISEPDYCSECHEKLKQDELQKLLNYESATIYITKFENRTARRNRNREQAYTIKPSQTLLELKKEIFLRCQVLPVDQRLFLNDVLLDDNSKSMSELRIVPNCSLKLEIDRPRSETIDLIEDEPTSRKACVQPETGFKGSLLLSNNHF